ncbi:5'-nucleotidase [Clostridium homopropionicum DSM 5847]|uniref:5'-nucleotidase n=1 Tax=Clostridium homopropionicum DSM 5847 TaxID=1121318 RepID=A0A0L6ZCV9_9CLOT|nr:HAD family hydrolase [Clostridium homopropionicum]KOA20814.1 5'-nucleotidase [Clostridium homopropionicum DSM 5847]SFF88462.1 phosphoglycolate phosphatase [Clostridium homopropionicum]
MKYKYILFDLDGTLTDPKVGITKSVKYALNKNNIEVESLDDLIKFIGPPLKESFMEFYSFDEERANKAIEYYREYFKDKGIFENGVYEGIPELLKELKNNGFIIAIATSKPTVFAERIVEHFGLKEYFHIVVGSNLDGTRTSKGEVISCVLEQLNINNLEEFVMIGDRKHDIIGAQENSIDSIGVLYGYGDLEEFQEVSPTYIVDSVNDLYKLIING